MLAYAGFFIFMIQKYADVILPLPLPGRYTYLIHEGISPEPEVGKRVIVQFGAKKFYSAIIATIHKKPPPEDYKIKKISTVLDESPVVFPENIAFWEWMAKYYCCTPGEVMKAALPSGLRLESETKIKKAPGSDPDHLSGDEQFLSGIIGEKGKSLQTIKKEAGTRFRFSVLNSLIQKSCIEVEEKVGAKYREKTQLFISLSSKIKSKPELNNIIDSLKRARKQEKLLLHFCSLANVFSSNEKKEISRKELLKGGGFTPAVLKALIKKEILLEKQKPVSRILEIQAKQGELNLLNPHQEKALGEIKSFFREGKPVLLFGVTSSGKTEIYTHLIDETIRNGKQVLYLVPEIALTAQLINRLKRVFGHRVGVYHSRLNDNERVEIWEKVVNFNSNDASPYQIVMGARSSILLPFRDLGLIIVDEEHETTYKQADPAPRYHARDMAVLLGNQKNCDVLLGTATPSFETYYNVKAGKFGLVQLTQRYRQMALPEIIVSDIQRAFRRKQMKAFLGPELFEKISESLDKNEQVILFQNRRGYAPFVECMNCGWIPKCEKCDVSLTYHKYKKQLTCHYCGYYTRLPEACHECGAPELKTRGLGTEKIEDELKKLFPGTRIARMDLDSTRGKHAFEKLVYNLENKKTDILVGTQMVTKGLDFEHVSLVGILNADNLINFPDFRAHERAYQLILQVSGRAGRKHRRGTVIIQTTQPQHKIIHEIVTHAYEDSFIRQMSERKLFRYPPYFRLIKITVKHKEREKLDKVAGELASMLAKNNQLIVLGPEFPLISRISLWYQKEIWLKLSRGKQLPEIKHFIIKCVEEVKHLPNNSSAVFNIDVDPI